MKKYMFGFLILAAFSITVMGCGSANMIGEHNIRMHIYATYDFGSELLSYDGQYFERNPMNHAELKAVKTGDTFVTVKSPTNNAVSVYHIWVN